MKNEGGGFLGKGRHCSEKGAIYLRQKASPAYAETKGGGNRCGEKVGKKKKKRPESWGF